MLWIDKHCPKYLDDFTSHTEVTDLLKKFLERSHDELPHFLFYGPSGSGKKTRILATLRSIFGPSIDKIKTDVIPYKETSEVIVCQSDHHVQIPCPELGFRDRVIIQDVIRNMSSAPSASNYFTSGPSYRVFILEDADSLTQEAQAALRRTMETCIKNARMFLHVRQLSRIQEILRNICNSENITPVQASDSMLNSIAESCNRNLRRSILMLEAVAMSGFTLEPKNFLMPWEKNVKKLADIVLQSQTPSTLSTLRPKIYELLASCVPGEVLLEALVTQLLKKIDASLVPNVIHLAAHFSHTIKLGSKDVWHIEALLAHVMSLISRKAAK